MEVSIPIIADRPEVAILGVRQHMICLELASDKGVLADLPRQLPAGLLDAFGQMRPVIVLTPSLELVARYQSPQLAISPDSENSCC